VETIATAVIGCGIHAQSMVEDVEGNDVESMNDARDKAWSEWCEVCDINGELNFAEIQFLALREIVESGEVIIRLRSVRLDGRPVPLALEMIDADRLALDRDTWAYQETGNRVIRGVEMDERGKPLGYWIYPEHPNSPYIAKNTTPVRVPADEILHLYRKDRVGQSRGVTWFAPVLNSIRDLGVYIDNELQASAVASCFTAVIKTDSPAGYINPGSGKETTDDYGNSLEYLEPGLVARLKPGESIEGVNPGRPNSGAEPWINLMVRNIGVGVGIGYEKVSRDYSRTTYSSARTAELEDRRRFKRFQRYIIAHLCQPVWDRFCEAAASVSKLTDSGTFPLLSELLDDRRALTPVTWQVPEWEWVDPQNEQAASVSAIENNMSTLQRECAKLGINWREVLRQRHKERKAEAEYGVQPIAVQEAEAEIAATTGQVPASAGGLKGMGRQGFKNTDKAMDDILFGLKNGTKTETQARVLLSEIGLTDETIGQLIADAMDDGVLNGSAGT
jgi:lambda family phage portal protein